MDFFQPPSADDLLLRQAGQGQPQALAQLVQRYQALAYTVAVRKRRFSRPLRPFSSFNARPSFRPGSTALSTTRP